MDLPSPPPPGFEVGTANYGQFEIRFRSTEGWGCFAVFFGVFFTAWFTGCVLATVAVLTHRRGIQLGPLLILVPFWIVCVAVPAMVVWHLFSITHYHFKPSSLLVERVLLWHRRRHVFHRHQVKAVKQIMTMSEEKHPGWSLLVEADECVCVLEWLAREKSDWLGPIIARWAGVRYEVVQGVDQGKYRTL